MEVSEDKLLGGRVRLRQPIRGYRVAIDPILLASAVPAKRESRVLDLGAGVGAAALCLAARVSGCRVDAVELQPELANIAVNNANLNRLEGRVCVHVCDVLSLPRAFFQKFDHVMANPPFLPADRSAPTGGKNLSTVECGARLRDWIDAAAGMLRFKGSLTFIHRADRLDELLTLIRTVAGEIVVAPIWPREGKPAKRVLVRARKGVSTPLRLVAGLTLYGNDGGYTATTESILRGGAPFVFDSDFSYPGECAGLAGDGWTAT